MSPPLGPSSHLDASERADFSYPVTIRGPLSLHICIRIRPLRFHTQRTSDNRKVSSLSDVFLPPSISMCLRTLLLRDSRYALNLYQEYFSYFPIAYVATLCTSRPPNVSRPSDDYSATQPPYVPSNPMSRDPRQSPRSQHESHRSSHASNEYLTTRNPRTIS
jgi:hypothetical protein